MFMELAGLLLKVLDGKSPRQRAAELVSGTRLKDVSARRALADGGLKAVQASNDPMLNLARLVDPAARKFRKRHEEKVDEPMRQAYAKISSAKFAVSGTDVYPDATFTLRLAFGTVKGYRDGESDVPPWTTLGGTFKHAAAHGNAPPFELPARWMKGQDKLDSATPYNFVSTVDIIGGNSGSPVVNRKGEVVGIIFDGNIPSLVWDYAYSDEQGRAVSVHSQGILESLKKLYDADKLVAELQPK
jgi:hypothetical protein